jgi:hypothetical protein
MPSRRAAALGIAAVLLVAVVVLAVTGAGKRTDLVLTTGVPPIYPVAPVGPGKTVCQKPLGITDGFDRVRVHVGTFGKPGPPLAVSVLDHRTGAELGRGVQPPGWVDNGTPRNVDVGKVSPGGQVDVCVRNEGRIDTYFFGDFYHGKFGKGPLGVTPTNSTNSADIEGTMIEGDLAVTLLSQKKRSALARIPSILRHAATFKPAFMDAWVYALLGLLILIGAPVALWAALASAGRSSEGTEPRDPSIPSTRRQ